MSRKVPRGVRFFRALNLALCLTALNPGPALAWQGTDQDLPLWRADFKKADPGVPDVNQPPPLYLVRENNRKLETLKPDTEGVVKLPEVPIKAELHERLLEVLGDDGLRCVLEKSSGVLTRTPRSPSHQPEDDIPLLIAEDPAIGAGWVEVNVPGKITKDQPGAIKLSIHGWKELSRRVGAGVFSGSLTLVLSNKVLQDGEPIRVSQPITIVISGSRVISVDVPKSLRVGLKPGVRVELESVELVDTVEQDAPHELDPGWWLQLDEPRKQNVVARLPLPLPYPATDPAGKVIFRISEKELDRKWMTDDRGWDTIEVPRQLGYELADEWKDQLILQRIERLEQAADLSPLPHVRVQRHAVSTFLPACYKPGSLEGLVYWNPSTTDRTVPSDPVDPRKEIASRKSLGTIAVASGLYVSTDMPISGEIFSVWVDLSQEMPPEKMPAELTVDVVFEDAATRESIPLKPITLVRKPVESTLARYQGQGAFDVPGHYKIKLNRGGEQNPLPPEWPDLSQAELPMTVLIEGEKDAPPFEDDSPLKVFTDGEPFWWVSGEPGFPSSYKNDRRPSGYHVNTNQAMSFRLAPGQNYQSMKLRYEGIFFDPTSNDQPTVAARRYEGTPPNPGLKLISFVDETGVPLPSPEEGIDEGKLIPLKEGEAGSRKYFDLNVDLKKLSSSQRDKLRSEGNQLRLARFVFMGLDAKDRPVGRVYSRRFKVAVRSQWDEFWDKVDPTVLALIGLLLVILIVILYKRRRRELERKRKARAAQAAHDLHTTTSTSATGHDRDYFSGLETMVDEHEPPPSPPSKTPKGPTNPPPKAEPSYFDDPGHGEDGAGSKYLD